MYTNIMTDKENIEEILYKFTNTYNGKTEMLHQDNFSGVINDLQTLLKEREKEILNKIPKGYTMRLRIGENDYACKSLKCTMKDIKEHNIESEGFDLGYKTAIDDIQKWKKEYLQSNNLEG